MKPSRRRRWWSAGLVLVVVVVVVLSGLRLAGAREVRAAADDAINDLRAGDLVALETVLADHRGQRDFAYRFASGTNPRELADALSSVVDRNGPAPLKAGVDPHTYELVLTDLAGALALATHGTRGRTLLDSWTGPFVKATTDPASLYGGAVDPTDEAARVRADQDEANKQNLLLLLSRGQWSTEFLKAVTEAYWGLEQAEGDNAWPGPVRDARYAPSPKGAYLSDGMLALTAALSANAAASLWAFTEFQDGVQTLSHDDTDHSVNKFSHYLFDGRFQDGSSGNENGHAIGMTATLAALSSAARATGAAPGVQDTSVGGGPVNDAIVLEGWAKSKGDGHGLSGFMNGVKDRATDLIQSLGPKFLEVLYVTRQLFDPSAALIDAYWDVVEGNYTSAGLSLAAVAPVPPLKVARVALEAKQAAKVSAKPTRKVEKAVEREKAAQLELQKAAEIAGAVKAWRIEQVGSSSS